MKRLLLTLLTFTVLFGLSKAQTLTVTPTTTNVTCNGANNGTASIAVSGCSGTPTYVWTPNVSSTNSASGLAPGSYTVNVTTPATSGSDTLFFDNFNTASNWSLANISGAEGSGPNIWVINSASGYTGSCSASNPLPSGNTMHVVCNGGVLCGLAAPNGEAAYNAGNAARVTDRYTALINSISTIGRTNVQVKFVYQSNGEGSNDYGNLRYSIDGGSNWVDLSTIYSGSATWICATVTLPVACENISTLKIGFRWRNNGNNAGSDPPMNIDNVLIRADGGSGGPGCSGSTTFTISEPTTALSVSNSSQTNVLCNGGSTGSVTVVGAGGTVGSGYQYKIGAGSYQASPTFSGLAAGSYVVTVKDANNCTSTLNVTITQPTTALSVGISSQTDATCGGNNGSVTVAGAGGTVGSGYQYKIGSGSYQASGLFSGLAAGSYVVTVLDANNCTSTVNVTINQPSNLSVSNSSQTNVLCNGSSTGSVTVAAAGGTPGYQYKIGSGSLQASPTFSGLAAGTYTITVQDANSCTSTVSVTITQPAVALSVTNSSQTNVLCNGGSTGSVTVAGAGGTVGSGYQYKIGTNSYQASPTFSGLAAGSYVITVLDANNCTAILNVTITQPVTPLSVSASSQTNVLCNGGTTGSVTLAGTGGTVGIGYQYKNGSGSYQPSPVFSGLSAGSYTFTVQDGNGCSATTNVTITQPATVVSGSITNQVNIACSSNTGSVTVAGAGGTVGSGYLYKLDNGSYQASGTFNNLAAGSYVVTVLDANNCTAIVNVTITQPTTPLSVASTGHTDVLCFGDATGAITVAGAGGTVGSGYQYKIGNGPYQASGTFSGLTAGNYIITVLDANNCTSTVNVTIAGPVSAVSVSNSNQTNATCGSSNGSVTVAGAGGTGAYQYNINNGAYQGSATFSNLAANTYTIGIKDANGCTSTVSVTINAIGSVNASLTSTGTITCHNGSDGAITVAGANGTPPYSYSIDGTNFGNSPTFGSLASGNYVITVKDNSGCADTVNVSLANPAPFVPTTNVTGNISICDGQTTQLTVTSLNSNACTWSTNETGSTITVDTAGVYNVTCTDGNNCPGTSADIIVGLNPIPTAAFNYSQTDNYHLQFDNQSLNADNYTWIFPGGVEDTTGNAIFNFASQGNYDVTLIAHNDCGDDTTIINVVVVKLTSVDEHSILSSFKLFPNPSNGTTTLQMNAVKPVKGSLNIMTAQGQLVYSEYVNFNTAYTKTIDLTKLAGGIYIITLNTDNINISRKLIIEK